MSIDYAMEVLNDCLCVTVGGILTNKDDVLGFAVPFRRKAEALGLKRIMIDCSKAQIRFSYYDSVQLAKHIEGSEFIYQKFRVAHLVAEEHLKLFADYRIPAANRGFFFEYFTDREDALAWLQKG